MAIDDTEVLYEGSRCGDGNNSLALINDFIAETFSGTGEEAEPFEGVVIRKTPVRRLEAMQRYHRNHPERHLERNRAWRRANPIGKLLQNAAERSRKLGLKFSITAADLEPRPTHCPILGIPLHYAVAGGGRVKRGDPRFDGMASIDRIKNEHGYIPGNVAIISWRANRIKNSGTAAEHRAIAAWMEKAGG